MIGVPLHRLESLIFLGTQPLNLLHLFIFLHSVGISLPDELFLTHIPVGVLLIKDMLGLLSLYFDKPLILINRQLDKQTKQMVCGYALGHYLEHQLLMDLHTLDKFLTIKDKHILLYEHNAFTSHLMLDSDEVYQMTKRGLDAAQISVAKRIHLNLVMVKLLELHHLGYDLRHYHAQHHAFIKQFNLPAHFQFDVAAG